MDTSPTAPSTARTPSHNADSQAVPGQDGHSSHSTHSGLNRRHWWRPVLALAAILAFSAYCIGLPVQAASLAASSASSALDSLSTSVGAFSNAVSGVSTSSSPGGGKVAQGQYRIDQAQALPGSPARVALDLQPSEESAAQGAQAWQLRLPAQVVAAAALEPGQVLAVRDRPYGFGLWQAGADQPFYLVVRDDWMQALQARPVDGR